MNIKRICCLIIILFLLKIQLSAQKTNFYLSSDAGVSTFHIIPGQNPGNLSLSSEFKLAWNIGINVEHKLSDNFSFDTGLKFLSFGTKEQQITQEFLLPSGIMNAWVYDERNITSRYLGVPLILKYKYRKFNVLAGYQVMYSMGGKYKYSLGNKSVGVPDSAVIASSNQTRSAKFTTWDTGLIFGINYELTSRLAARLQVYTGLNKITSDLELEGTFRKNKNMTVGLQYYLSKME